MRCNGVFWVSGRPRARKRRKTSGERSAGDLTDGKRTFLPLPSVMPALARADAQPERKLPCTVNDAWNGTERGARLCLTGFMLALTINTERGFDVPLLE